MWLAFGRMQSFSPCLESVASSTLLAAAKPNPSAAWNDLAATYGIATSLFYFFATLVVGVLSIWVGSLATAGKQATFGRALLTWFGWFVASIVVAVCATLGLSLAMGSGNQMNFLIGLALLGVLFLIVIFGVPMSVYQFGVLRSIGMVIITTVTSLIGQFCLGFAFFGGNALSQLDLASQWKAATQPQQSTPAASRTDLIQRRDALRGRYDALEIRRKHLPPGDAKALADYQRDVREYESDLAQLRAEAKTRIPTP